MESQQFESSNFQLNPVLRMAIMRKVLSFILKNFNYKKKTRQ